MVLFFVLIVATPTIDGMPKCGIKHFYNSSISAITAMQCSVFGQLNDRRVIKSLAQMEMSDQTMFVKIFFM